MKNSKLNGRAPRKLLWVALVLGIAVLAGLIWQLNVEHQGFLLSLQ